MLLIPVNAHTKKNRGRRSSTSLIWQRCYHHHNAIFFSLFLQHSILATFHPFFYWQGNQINHLAFHFGFKLKAQGHHCFDAGRHHGNRFQNGYIILKSILFIWNFILHFKICMLLDFKIQNFYLFIFIKFFK